MPLLQDPGLPEFRDAIYYHFYEEGWGVSAHHGVRTERYKLIRFTTPPESWELYDLETDPHEMDNLYTDPVYQGVITTLEQQMNDLQVQYGISGE